MLRIIVLLFIALFAVSASAVEPEAVVLEEEGTESGSAAAAASESDGQTTTKKKRKKKKRKKKKVDAEAQAAAAAEAEAAAAAEAQAAAEAKAAAEAEAAAAEKAAKAKAKKKEEEEEAAAKEEAARTAGGLECSPAVNEVETRRPIPVSCAVTRDGIERVEIRYRAPGKKKYVRVQLKPVEGEWQGEIPCAATAKAGTFKLAFTGKGKGGKTLARIDTLNLKIVESTDEPPPSLPGLDPPMRCYGAAECPAELKGSKACPGTKVAAGGRAWGASCAKSSECQTGLGCVNGTCDTPPKCETTSDCPTGGECSDGVCSFPDPSELADRLGPPKMNWIGLHFGVDLMLVREAVGVCGNETDDSKNYTCFQGGDAYDGTPNQTYSGTVKSGFRMATMRALVSYDRWFGRFAVGTRLGFAFGGAPKDFFPIHIEARALYSLRADPLSKRGRPYLGLAFGLAQADPKSKVTIVDCTGSVAEIGVCRQATNFQGVSGARKLTLDAYRTGSKFFFGPTLGYMYAFANDSAISLSVNVMFPELVLEPTLGYVMGI